jgi:hypothetical protein
VQWNPRIELHPNNSAMAMVEFPTIVLALVVSAGVVLHHIML